MTKISSNSRFEKHPRATIAALLILVFIVLDLALGYFFCPRIVGTPDAYYHHDLPKKISGTKPWGRREYRVFTNSLGFIDREIREVARTSEHPRILFIGDSFTEGVGNEYDETFVGRFSAKVADKGIEVLNTAVTSYSPRLYYLKLRYLLRNVGLRFDELIVCIDISDIQDEIDHAEFLPVDDFGISRYYLLNRLDSLLRQSSLSYYAIRSRFSDAVPKSSPFVVGKDLMQSWEEDRGRWTVAENVYRGWGAEGLRLAGRNMDLLADLCAEHGVKLTVVVYPWPTQIVNGDLDSLQVRYWRDFCQRRKINFINLFPDFFVGESAEQVLGQYFIPGDVHWNAAGHKLVADKIYESWRAR